MTLKEQFRYLVEHGVEDHGMTVGDACDLAVEKLYAKLVACAELQVCTSDIFDFHKDVST